MTRLAEFRTRREQLIARAAVQRAEFVRELRPLSGPIATAGRVFAGITWLRRHPLAMAVAVAVVVAIRPRRILSGVGQGIALWRIAQNLLPAVAPIVARLAASRLGSSRAPR